MILEPFKYFAPETLDDAISLLEMYGEEAKIIAGGQSLIPILKMGVEIPYLIDIKKIPNLREIRMYHGDEKNQENLAIGALITHSELAMSPEVRKQTPLLSMTAAGIGHQLIRNRGTIGGSMVHCDPAADLCTTSLVLEAKVRLTSAGGKFRDVSAEKFFLGPLTTDIRHNEILSEVIFPIKKGKRGYDVEKFTMGHGDFPLFIASVMMGYSDGRFNDIAIGMGSVSDTAIRDHELESFLSGRNEIGESEIEEVVRMAMEKYEGQPTGELTKEYSTKMIGVYLRKALTKSLAMIRG